MKSKEQKKMEAQERQEAYDALTPKEKIAKLDALHYVAKKQRAKLAKEL